MAGMAWISLAGLVLLCILSVASMVVFIKKEKDKMLYSSLPYVLIWIIYAILMKISTDWGNIDIDIYVLMALYLFPAVFGSMLISLIISFFSFRFYRKAEEQKKWWFLSGITSLISVFSFSFIDLFIRPVLAVASLIHKIIIKIKEFSKN